MFKRQKELYTIMKLEQGAARANEIVAESPGDIQVVVYGESFPAKRLKSICSNADQADSSSISGCVELGDWLTESQRGELRKLMSFPNDHPATVFQILINVPPMRRLICEWPHNGTNQEDSYCFMQLADLEQ